MSRQTRFDWFTSRSPRPAVARAAAARRRGRTTQPERQQHGRRLRCEPLEDRRLLAIFVDTYDDVIDPNDGVTSLREAVAAASAGEEVVLPFIGTGGTQFITLDSNLGEVVIDKDLIIRGNEIGVRAASSANHRIFRGTSDASFLEFSNLTIENGNADGDGGGIYAENNVALLDVDFVSNSAAGQGGGLYVGGFVDIFDGGFFGNEASAGGGLAANEVFMRDSRFDFNQAFGDGGGLHANIIDIGQTSFRNNTAGQHGGGLYLDSLFTGAFSTISDATFRGNTASGNGGGIHAITDSDLTIDRTEIIDGNSANNGGGIYAETFTEGGFNATSIRNSTIAGNSATTHGGGLYALNSEFQVEVDPGNPELGLIIQRNATQLFQTTVSGNSALNGGGVYLENPHSDVPGEGFANSSVQYEIAYSTIANNTLTDPTAGDQGGQLVVEGGNPVEAISSIIHGTSIPPLGLYDVAGENFFSSHGLYGSLSPDVSSGHFSVLLGVNPLLEPLANNGGPTRTHALMLGSPAINTAPATATQLNDQRGEGFAREVGGLLDIGAFELQIPEIVVTTAEDAVDSSDNLLSLREAITVAKTRSDTPTITFAPALENQTIVLLLGELLIDDHLTIEGPGADLLTLVARDPTPTLNNSDGSRVFRIVDPNGIEPVVSISGMTMTNGDADNFGGAIYADAGSLTVEDAVLSDNYAPLDGGAIHMTNGELFVRRSRFLDNTSGTSGGGIQVGSGGTFDGNATIEDSNFMGNSAGGNGGGIDVGGGPLGQSLTVRRSVFEGNEATAFRGGGIYTHTTTTNVTIEDSILRDNSAKLGGGLHFNSPGINAIADVSGSTFSGNSASERGGAIYLDGNQGAQILVESSTVEGNSAILSGAGIQADKSFSLTNSTVSGNTGAADGGGGLIVAGGSVATITHSTITQNRAGVGNPNGSGGGIFMFDGSTLHLDHTIVAENDDNGNNIAPDLNLLPGEPNSVSHSLIGDNAGSGLAEAQSPDSSGNLIGASMRDSLTVSIQMAAMGDFELEGAGSILEDSYYFEFSTNGGFAWAPLFVSTVDEAASATYTLEDGSNVSLNDPLLVNGIQLNNNFQTLTATIPAESVTDDLSVRFRATTDGGSEAFAFRNMFIRKNNAANELVGRALSAAPDLLVDFSADSDFADLDDMFGVRNAQDALPRAMTDDSVVPISGDNIDVGIIKSVDSFDFFGVVDTVNGENPGPDPSEKIALWTFEVPGGAIDPQLAPLRDNGGPTRTHVPLDGSLVIDAGDASIASPPLFDQRGTFFNRISDGNGNGTPRIDIGAVEQQTIDVLPFPLVVDSAIDEYDGEFSAGHLSLREALSFANLVEGADTIEFDASLAGSTINLTRGELDVTEGLTINGLGTDQLAIDASWNDPTPDEHNGDGSRVLDLSQASSTDVFAFNKLAITGADITGSGGGIYTFSPLTVSEIAIRDNHSAFGGGIYASEPLTVSQSTIAENSASGSGGGVYFTGSADPLLIESSTFTKNSAGTEGGGLWSDTDRNGAGVGLIRSSTFSGNTAIEEGGGIRNWIGALTIEHSTITANTAADNQGSGISSYGLNDTRTELYSTIVAGNYGSDVDANPQNVNSFGSAGYNLIGTGNAAANFTLPGDQSGITSPKLGPLGDNGGPTFTHALLPGSPAIDAGELSPTSPPTTDQRGAVRIVDGDQNTLVQIDIGAYELQQPIDLIRGDYNQNGVVDAADYTVWRDSLGDSVPAFTGADGDGNGIVDQQDYLVWRTNFGATTTTGPDLSQSLIGYWPFDNGGTDQSITGADLSLVGSATTPPGGIIGNALSLNNPQPSTEANVNQWAQRSGDDNIYDLVNTDFTIQTWFLLASADGAEQVLIDKLEGGGAGAGWTLSVKQQDGTLQFYTASGGFVSVDQPSIGTGVWHQAIVRQDASGTDLWFDGSQIAEDLLLPAIEPHSEQLRVGRRNPAANQGLGLSGRIDEVAIWDRALENSDIQYLWNDGFGRPVLDSAPSAAAFAGMSEDGGGAMELATTSASTFGAMPVFSLQDRPSSQTSLQHGVNSQDQTLTNSSAVQSEALLLHLLNRREEDRQTEADNRLTSEPNTNGTSVPDELRREIDTALASW